MENYDKSIIDLYVKNCKPYPLHEDLFKNSKPLMEETGKLKLRKSKYKLVNWFRKITKTEKYEKEYTYIYEYPY